MKGTLIVEDAIKMLMAMAEAFWEQCDKEIFADEISDLAALTSCLIAIDKEQSSKTMDEIMTKNSIGKLLLAYDSFYKACANVTEMCRYWKNFLRISKSITQLVRADREGDFLLHTQAVGDLNVIVTGGDGVHYQLCCSFYHELIKNVKNSHPDLYTHFMQGDFIVQTTAGSLNAVSGDMKLEQTIQRSSKTSHGIIGRTRNLSYVTEWQMIYHEVLAIKYALQELIKPHGAYQDD